MMKRSICVLLFFLILPTLISAQSRFSLSHPPGSYNRDILLTIEPGFSGDRILYSFDGDSPEEGVPYTLPLKLSSIPGEERSYKLRIWVESSDQIVEQRNAEFVLDKRIPVEPVPSVPAGTYNEELFITFSGTDGKDEILYSINEPIARSPTVWRGDPIQLTAETYMDKVYTVLVYARDRAGNSTALQSYTYIVRPEQLNESASLNVLSPVEGDFANPQMLYVVSNGYQWIKYTFDGSDPERAGTLYTRPVDIPQTGEVTLRIAAKSSSSERVFTEEITYMVTPVSNIKSTLTNGFFTDPVTVRLEADNEIFYTLDDSVPAPDDLLYVDPFELKPLQYSKKTVILRFSSYSQLTSRRNEHRYILILDDRVPKVPAINVRTGGDETGSNHIIISGPPDAEIYYTLNGTQPNLRSARYIEPVYIKELISDGGPLEIRSMTAYPNGRTSDTAVKKLGAGEKRPKPPEVTAEENPETLDIIVKIENTADTSVVFELSPGPEKITLPDSHSPVCNDTFTVSVPHGMNKSFYFTFAALDEEGVLSETVNLTFSIDRKSSAVSDTTYTPPPPTVLGIHDGGTYNSSVLIIMRTSHPEDGILYRLADESAGDSEDESWVSFNEPFTIDVPEGEHRRFSLEAVSVDEAGNQSEIPVSISFTIDKIPPEAPLFYGVPEPGITSKSVQLIMESGDADVYFATSSEANLSGVPGPYVEKYSSPVVFSGRPGQEIVYTVSAVSIDSAGNMSLNPSVLQFVIDRKAPPVPRLPEVDKSLLSQGFVQITWGGIQEDELYYSIEGAASSGEFTPFEGPFFVPVEENSEGFRISYYSEDTAGNTSDVSTYRVLFPKRGDKLVHGIEDGGKYSNRVNITSNVSNGVVRYEIVPGNGSPRRASRFSPILENELVIDSALGETRSYTVSLALFTDETESIAIREERYYIEIDRTPPPSPSIQGVEKDRYYQNDVTISLSHTEGRLFYLLANVTAGEASGVSGKYNEYAGPITIESKPGEFEAYRISAYTLDEAGNRSPEKSITFFIDRDIIYISRIGNDLYDGSRENSFRSIQRALHQSAVTGRKTIFIGAGEYHLKGTLELENDITIVGGFDPETWKKSDDKTTVLLRDDMFTSDMPIVWAKKGKIILRDLGISAEKQNSTLIRAEAGETHLTGVTVNVSNCSGNGVVHHTAGSLAVSNSTIESSNSDIASLIHSSGDGVLLNGSSFSSEGSGEISILHLNGVREAEIKDAVIRPGTGSITTGITCEETEIALIDTAVSGGKGTDGAFGINISGGILEMEECSVKGESASRISTLVYADSAALTINRSSLDAGGYQGSIALNLNNSRIEMFGSTLTSGSSREFLYFIKSMESSGLISNNHFLASTSGDVIACETTSSSLDFFNNTVLGLQGKRMTLGFRVIADRGSRIINNIVASVTNSRSTAVLVTPPSTIPELRANDFKNWELYLQEGNTRYTSVDHLNQADGKPFSGSIHMNIDEELKNTFIVSKDGEFRLKESSLCVDGGVDVKALGGHDIDWDGEKRPNPRHGLQPTYDIGADEFYR